MDLAKKVCEDSDNPLRCEAKVSEALETLSENDLDFLAIKGDYFLHVSEDSAKWGLSPGE